MSELIVYESRLREYVPRLLSRPASDKSEAFLKVLPTRSEEQWIQDVSEITLTESKLLLGAEEAPTNKQLLALPKTKGEHRPGCYMGTIFTPGDENDVHGYFGSGTRPSFGIEGRTDEHLDPLERARVRGRTSSYHYNIVDEPGKNRYGEYRQFCRTDFASGDPEEILYTRATCIFAEQLYMSWLKTHSRATIKRYPWLSELTPWETSPRHGLNGKLPLMGGIRDAPQFFAPLTPAERNERYKMNLRTIKSRDTREQRDARRARQARYDREVQAPVLKMRAQGIPEQQIKAFQDEHRKMIRAENPKFGFGVGHFYATATPRSEEERLDDLAGGKRKRRALGEVSGNAVPAKKTKVGTKCLETPPKMNPAEDEAGKTVPQQLPKAEISDPVVPFHVVNAYPTALKYLGAYHDERKERSGWNRNTARGAGWPGVWPSEAAQQ